MSRIAARRGRTQPVQTPRWLNLFAIPTLACVFAVIVSPLVELTTHVSSTELGSVEAGYDNKLFWPMLAAAAVVFAALNFSRVRTLALPPHLLAFLVYFAFAGATVLWAYAPEISLTRYVQQAMIVTSIVVPTLLASQRTDLLHGLFLCFAIAIGLNLAVALFGGSTESAHGVRGYFQTKNQLGAFAAVSLLLSLNEMLYPGRRRVLGIVVGIAAFSLLLLGNSKTALGLVFLAPVLAGLAVAVRRTTGLSPLFLPVSLILFYFLLSSVSGFNMARLSYMLYGDPTFTGRETIWEFASYQIAQRPLLGWGYRGFWLIGPDAPSVTEAPGWVKLIPNGHSGYYDTLLELGYVGFTLMLVFLAATLHAMGRVVDVDAKRGWVILSIAFFVICTNGLESSWLRGFEILWVVFLVVTAETGRYWKRRHQVRGVQRRHSAHLAGHPRLAPTTRSAS